MKVKNVKELMKGLNNRIKKLEQKNKDLKDDFKYCVFWLLDSVEQLAPAFYYRNDTILEIDDIIKKHFDNEEQE